MLSQQTEGDKYKDRLRLHRRLCATVYQIWQDKAASPKDDGEREWWEAYEREKSTLTADENPAYDEWLTAHVKKHGLPTCPESYLRGIYLAEWKRKHKPVGRCREVLSWEKQYFQLFHCQGEWIGYRAECCKEKTHPVAVPIGCNHRLCPLCAWHRSEKARRKTKKLFDRLTHPIFLTLTIPNKDSIRKHDFKLFRQRVRQLIGQNSEWIRGGVYSLETTYNRTEKTWHIHAHVLADVTRPLPTKQDKTILAGRSIFIFTEIKRRLEFDWLRLWINDWGKHPTKAARPPELYRAEESFRVWFLAGERNQTRRYYRGEWQTISGLSEKEFERRTAWNRENRRMVDVRPVTDRNKAAMEVLKYITKSADFCDVPEAVEEFYNAAKSTRLIQTFGTWYGAKLDGPCDHEDPDDWGELKCACGANFWHRIGLFYRDDVRMESNGRWLLARAFDWRSPGTVARPTIRALDGREEAFGYGYNSDDVSNIGSATAGELEAR